MELISQGAEAHLFRDGDVVLKRRVTKSYRLPILDLQLRKQRTRSEAKLLQKAGDLAPKLLAVDEVATTITLEYIPGDLLKSILPTLSPSRRHTLLVQLGKHIATLHQCHIIHGDLTTSNILVAGDRLYLLDFGLGFISLKQEDKAVDLYLLKHAFMSKHALLSQEAFASVLEGYALYSDSRAVLQRLEKIDRRGRYKQKKML